MWANMSPKHNAKANINIFWQIFQSEDIMLSLVTMAT